MKNKNQQTLSENFIINNYLKKLNFKKKESFNFENDGAYLNISQMKKLLSAMILIVEGVDFFTNETQIQLLIKLFVTIYPIYLLWGLYPTVLIFPWFAKKN